MAAFLGGFSLLAFSEWEAPQAATSPRSSFTASSVEGAPPIRFQERAESAGLRHTHQARRFKGPKAGVLETFTSGGASVAVGDFDGDERPDIFLTDSDEGRPNRLFRNNGDGTFSDVAAAAGVSGGNDPDAVVADALFFDFDNDGDQDLLVVRFGRPVLYRNLGGGKFEDVSRRSGLDKFANSLAAIAFDADGDGFLDVLLGNYFPPVSLFNLESTRILPDNLDDAHNGGGLSFWRNNGGGSFSDRTEKAGFSGHRGWTLDVGHGDLDNDGDQDVYVAGDYGTDRVYFNRGDGTFREATTQALGGFDTKKGMNAEIADYDNDGWMDVYVTNITDEYMKECNMLWRNNGDGTFTDLSQETETCDTLWGWGAKFADFDNDGWQDLYAVNGLRSAGRRNYVPVLFEMIVTPGIDFSDLNTWPDIEDMSWSGYQKSKLFRNRRGEIFEEMAARAGVDNELDGRGVAIADFNKDGKLDICQSSANQPTLIYKNTSGSTGHWVQLRLVGDPGATFKGRRSNRDAIGARVTLKTGGLSQLREVQGGNGYAAQSSKVVHFGIGPEIAIDPVQVRWPSGRIERFRVPIDRLTTIHEGQGFASEDGKVGGASAAIAGARESRPLVLETRRLTAQESPH